MSKFILAACLLCVSLSLKAAEPEPVVPASNEEAQVDIKKISESFGHLIGKNIQSLGFNFEIADLIRGLQNSIAGEVPPMSEQECVQAISVLQEVNFKKVAEENLKVANEFMEKNKTASGIVQLDADKLHYKIEKEGSGAEVQAHSSPIIRYTGKYIDGTIFGFSKDDEQMFLDEAIPGFNRGLIGMKEGEKRTLFIHPDLGYGSAGYLPPNSLLTFDIELVRAHSIDSELETLVQEQNEADHSEIVIPTLPSGEVIR